MTEDRSILYFAPSTCARVTLTALEEIGEPFETRLIAFMAGEHRKPEYLAINPAGKVPALQTKTGVLTQNGAILFYLAQTYPEAGLLPLSGDPQADASVLSSLFRMSADLHPLVTRFVIPGMILSDPASSAHVRAKAEEVLKLQLEPIATQLGKQPWYLGERWSILDAYLAWIWFRITGAGFDPATFPAIADHYDRASARPSARAALQTEARAQQDLTERGLAFTPPKL
ncbi:glutathione S-transferase family protein [Sphingorhabdus sp. SMR4y]|uniref:glutathione S-transferase family protein n=1 Tax=Sphingorhabdus sp. SMR4y TaxID=2584094 RepID=UPI000B5C6FE9|nr:glutathione S-transferase family protein [Sphingorhabdus sp. SMR4y]ASK89726.1 glutathione S-transferase GST-4.5 [Sphingorhabdus sp. SMR4y]